MFYLRMVNRTCSKPKSLERLDFSPSNPRHLIELAKVYVKASYLEFGLPPWQANNKAPGPEIHRQLRPPATFVLHRQRRHLHQELHHLHAAPFSCHVQRSLASGCGRDIVTAEEDESQPQPRWDRTKVAGRSHTAEAPGRRCPARPPGPRPPGAAAPPPRGC